MTVSASVSPARNTHGNYCLISPPSVYRHLASQLGSHCKSLGFSWDHLPFASSCGLEGGGRAGHRVSPVAGHGRGQPWSSAWWWEEVGLGGWLALMGWKTA